MAEIHHFAHGAFNPVAAYLLSFIGCLLGLVCTARARATRQRARRTRWLVLASIAIGGAGIWLMHFMAMLGFAVPASPLRLDPYLTLSSLVLAVVTVGGGLFIVGFGRRRALRVIGGGVLTGLGVVGMHYTGMLAVRVYGDISYNPRIVLASVGVAVVAATVALWFTVTVGSWSRIAIASGVMAVAVCGMHYTGMAAIQVRLHESGIHHVQGVSPMELLVPIVLITSAALIGMAFSGLKAMTEEEFEAPPPSAGGRHGETPFTVALRPGSETF
ncbi:MHYT domain-containing protein, NO-binding membrane sensor [Asanoa hainanensis]|uniref:MHYT domain-containing protein, NO-binding membrane sensor n=1 Tax=Asanoa hainanensis TaxID=560556 RepID=A0A239PDQ7_9ACTN|nr:MHYT domain-containing protein [Asanoa hainanensis]SNT65186.1 MHYT domain-containing protein, NO-binding membrane sensor [Asanoa hainanensis]